MAKLSIQAGLTSKTVNIFIQDSRSASGAGLTGLVFNTAGLTAYYALPLAASVSIALVTLAAITTAYASGGFKEVDATNMPGWYRLDLPNAAIASGTFVGVHLQGAANMVPLPLEIELTAINNQSTAFGLVLAKTTNITGFNDITAAQAATGVWQDTTAGDFTAANSIGKSVLNGVALGTGLTINAYTGNTVQTGDAFARLGAPAGASVSADVAAVKSDTAAIKTSTNTGVAPGASGGIIISGSNSGTTTLGALTVTGATTHTGNVSMAAGLNITQSTANTAALVVTGNGSGNGATITGGAAVTTTAAGNGLALTGGAASTGVGGVSGSGVSVTGGAGAASTNGSAAGAVIAAGGTTTVSGNDGVKFTGTGNGNGATLTHAGSGQDFNATTTPLTLAKTTNITGFNDIAASAIVSSGAITTSGGAVSTVTTTTTATNLTNAPIAGDFTATMKTSLNAATPAVTVSDKTGFALTSAYDFAKGTVAMTESYAAKNATLTPAQALYAINQQLGEQGIVGTTMTVKKRDQSTTAKTFTLNDATTPTAITEAT